MSYHIPLDSKISKTTAEKYLGQYKGRAIRDHYATNFIEMPENTIAIIAANSQPFWVMDMREDKAFQKANIPYLIASPFCEANYQSSDSHAHYKGIHRNSETIFGRDHEYGKRFYDTYAPFVSRNHFRVDCDEWGNLFVVDLKSTNGTRLITETPKPPHAKRVDEYAYTPTFLDSGMAHVKDDQDPSDLSDAFKRRQYDNKLTVSINGIEYPAIDRDTTTFNGAIDIGFGGPYGPDILLDADNPEIEHAYRKLQERLSQRPGGWRSMFQDQTKRKLQAVYDTVMSTLPYDENKTNQISQRESRTHSNGKLISLSNFVYHHCGVCRHQTLLGVCLLEKMREDDLITGTIHAERNRNVDSSGELGGHEWITFQESPNNPVYVVDVAQEYIGTKEDADNWNYRLSGQS